MALATPDPCRRRSGYRGRLISDNLNLWDITTTPPRLVGNFLPVTGSGPGKCRAWLRPVVLPGALCFQFRWPKDGLPTIITGFHATYDEIGGCGPVAYVRGRSQVMWTVDNHGALEKFHNSGTFLTLLRKMPDGSWKISHQMWDDPPNQKQ